MYPQNSNGPCVVVVLCCGKSRFTYILIINSPVLDQPYNGKLPPKLVVLTHWGRDKMATVSRTTLSNVFSWMKILEFRLRFHWSLFLNVQLAIIQHWFRKWLGADQATSHYLKQWWLVYWRRYASLDLNELILRHHKTQCWLRKSERFLSNFSLP